ncbi:helix-turn-helix transcriptional regulator [Actinoallomurus oryzae]|uniref:Helix-turn-helix transcriptional regulator n=1 Tax=Actinoallomurus oryzae TaxID=502180 RepID=A0ABP8R9S0_9ACTN
MPTSTHLRERKKLGDRLREVRESTGLSGNRFAQRLGWLQSKVSKLETAKQSPTPQEIREWGVAAGAPPAVVDELLAQLERARMEYATWKEHYRAAGGASGKQISVRTLEAQTTRIRKFQPAMIPSQLQTAEYARELLHLPSGPAAWGASETDIDQMVAARMERQQILYQPAKRIQLIVLEAALRTRLCSPGTMAGQLDRLIGLTGLPALEFGIIPFERAVPVFPTSGFVIFDDHLVVVETLTGEQQLSDPDELTHYERWFDLLRETASIGRDAVPIIKRALVGLADAGEPAE